MISKLLAIVPENAFNVASPVSGTPFQPLAPLTVQGWIRFSISFLLVFGAVAFFIYLLVGGVQYILAAGDKEATQKASRRITHGLIGLTILLSGFAIIYLVGAIFGSNFTQFVIPSLQN
jgi:hypothetical protein